MTSSLHYSSSSNSNISSLSCIFSSKYSRISAFTISATGKNIYGDPASAVSLEALCKAVGIDRVRVCDPYDLKETQKAVNEELAADGPSVIISRRPCALLKTVKHNPPLAVDTDKCIGCKACMAIGCPAISQRDGKAVIDRTQCVGCGVCEGLCPKQAIVSKEAKA